MFRKSLMLCATSLLFVGCEPMQEDAFREGLPSKEMVAVKEPGGTTGQSLEGREVSAYDSTQGGQSEYYSLTRTATRVVNGGTEVALLLVEKVTKHPPTSISGDVAVWGPYTDALSPTTWKLEMTQTGDNSYSYKLEGKAKEAADSEYKVVLSGTHDIAVDAQGNRLHDYGSGNMTFDWDAAQQLPEHGKEVGTAAIRYSRLTAGAVATVEADFRNVMDDKRPDTRINVDYRYKETPGAGGEFDFAINKNFDNDPARPAIEHLTIKSRWTQDGAGRADARITGGDYQVASATASECWDVNFASQFLEASWVPFPIYGTVAACGSFNSAVYSGLAVYSAR